MLFSDILNVSITASWLVLAVLILRLLLRKAPKWTHVALWGLVAVRLLLPFSIESVFSLIPSTETVPPEILSYEGEQLTQPGRLDIVTNPAYAEDITIQLPQTEKQVVDLTVIWLAGVAVMGLYAILSYLRLRWTIHTAVRRDTGIYQSEAVASPFVLGIIRPKIFLPFAITDGDMTHVVAHERAHIRRKDHWWKPLGFALLTVHWFNPVMCLAYILLCRDIELACDEKVIKELGTEQRADYSQALLSCAVHRHAIAACPLAFGEVGVKERVKSVLNYKKPAFWIVIVAIIACIAVAVCFLTDPVKNEDPAEINPGNMTVVDNISTLLQGTNPLTLQDVITLSQKGTALSREDLAPYQCTDVGSGICIFRYEIDSFFYLDLSLEPTGGAYPETATEHFVLHHISGKFVDIRTGDVQAFIFGMQHSSYPYFNVKDNALIPYGWEGPLIRGTVLHGSSSDGLSERFEEIEDTVGILPPYGSLTLNFQDEVPLRITWKTLDPYNTSNSGSIDAPTAKTDIHLGINYGSALSSNLENIPPRRVQILCQYKDHTVEYLLIIGPTSFQ